MEVTMTYEEACFEVFQLEEEIQVLQSKKYREEQVLDRKQQEFNQYTDELYREQYDVKQLEKNSLGTILKKMTGKFEEQYEKETREFLAAKAKYDEYSILLEDLKSVINRYQNEICRKQQEIKKKKITIRETYPEGLKIARQEEEERKKLFGQNKELEEAITATQRVYQLATNAMSEYEGAKSWATYDTFFKGGLIADLAKYDKIDKAAACVSQLNSAANQMKKELSDVKMAFDENLNQIDGSTRFFDIAFDNIFTDWNVRDQLADNIQKLNSYCNRLSELLCKLRMEKSRIEKKLSDIG